MSSSSASLTRYPVPLHAEDAGIDAKVNLSANDLIYTPPDNGLDLCINEIQSRVRFSAMNLLARREHGFAELMTKLKQRFRDDVSCSDIQNVVQRLRDQGLQCDRRFAQSFVRMRCLQGKGPVRVCYELKTKSIDEALVQSAVYEQQLDWFEAAKSTYERKYPYPEVLDYRERAKRLRFMTYRGYTSDQISYAMSMSG